MIAAHRRLSVRIPAELYEGVRDLAQQDRRSIGWMLCELARLGLALRKGARRGRRRKTS